jgi:hypothetical protein
MNGEDVFRSQVIGIIDVLYIIAFTLRFRF